MAFCCWHDCITVLGTNQVRSATQGGCTCSGFTTTPPPAPHIVAHLSALEICLCLIYLGEQIREGGLNGTCINSYKVLNNSVLWDITPCSPLKVSRRFGGICRLQLQGRRMSQARSHEVGSGESVISQKIALHNHRCENLKSCAEFW
jgi:hypothetical protein